MKKKYARFFSKEMIRPTVYKVLIYMIVAFVIAGVWERFVNVRHFYSMRSFALPILGVVFLVLAWFRFLQLDGLRVLQRPWKRNKDDKTRTRNMSDYIETDPEDGDLDQEERAFSSMAAGLISGVACVIIGII